MAKLLYRQVEKYVATDGRDCPFCGSDDMDSDDDNSGMTNGSYYVIMNCNKCGETWTEIYNLVGLSDSDGIEIIVSEEGK